jgi:alpha-N-arabinofuranosidase
MNRIIIETETSRGTISRHIYGHFAEHLGRCIYDGICAGKLDVPQTRGVRNDIIKALKHIKIPNLRWPGGCFADDYHWMDGIGPCENRPYSINTHWGNVLENNHFGTHEFLDLCEQLECEPCICGNVGSGTVKEMKQWVEYLTFNGESTLVDLRKKNGRDKPWKIKYWGVGNENWGCGGKMRPEYYADLYKQYANYLLNFGDNKLYKIACGPNRAMYHWTEVLMREAGNMMDGLSLHYYTVTGKMFQRGTATQFTEKEWFMMMKRSLFVEELIKKHSAIMDQYDPEGRVALIIDEWGTWHDVEPGTHPRFLYQQNTLRDALVAGIHLNIFNQYCQRVKMANIAQTVNVLQALILTDGKKMLLTPTYHIFDMYKVHHDAELLPLFLDSDSYQYGEETTLSLNASASRGSDGRVHISICNLDPHKENSFPIILRGLNVRSVSGQILTASEMNSHNTFDNPDTIRPVEFKVGEIKNSQIQIKLPAKSVVTLSIES